MLPFAISSEKWNTTSDCPYSEGCGLPPEAAGHSICGLIPDDIAPTV